jgi:hypothetical protein
LALDQIASCVEQIKSWEMKKGIGGEKASKEQVEQNSQFDMVMNCFLIDVINVIVNFH